MSSNKPRSQRPLRTTSSAEYAAAKWIMFLSFGLLIVCAIITLVWIANGGHLDAAQSINPVGNVAITFTQISSVLP